MNLKRKTFLKKSQNMNVLKEFHRNNALLLRELKDEIDFKVHSLSEDVSDFVIHNDSEFKIKSKSEKKSNEYLNVNEIDSVSIDKKQFNNKNNISENHKTLFKVKLINEVPTQTNDVQKNDIEEAIKNDSTAYKPSSEIQVSELQDLIINMALSRPIDDNVQEDTTARGLNITIKDSKNLVLSPNPISNKEISNILNIIPMRIHITERHNYLLRKYILKWRKYVDKRKEFISRQRHETLRNFLEKLEQKKKVMNNQTGSVGKAKLVARDYKTYHHRYKMQKHIIALQRAKLEEQKRVIEELKYNKIIEASRQSVDEMREEVRRTYFEIDRHLKPKIKCLTNDLKIPEIEEPPLVLHCLKVPQFLQRMEQRARQREEKHAIIRERRRQLEEERIRNKQQAEIARAEMDKEEKERIVKELREKRKREKIENIRKKQHIERMRALVVMADLHFERNLMMKYGIRPLKRLLKIKRDNIEKAKAQYIFQLKKNVFLNWMWYTEDMWFERNYKAEDFYRKKILRRVFSKFKEHHYEFILKKQVADDYYDLYVTQLAFRMFREGVQITKREYEVKWHKAILYHNSNLLFKTFTYWRTLPALNALWREQEARKSRWRERVLQVVPDFVPPED